MIGRKIILLITKSKSVRVVKRANNIQYIIVDRSNTKIIS